MAFNIAMKVLVLLLTVLACLTHTAKCAKVLGVFPFPTSHYILGSALMKGLAEKGQDVTVINLYGEKTPPKGKYRDIVLDGVLEEMDRQRGSFNMFDRSSLINMMPSLFLFLFVSSMQLKTSEQVFSHPNTQALINSGETFDVIIIEEFMFDSLKGLSTHFNASMILLTTQGANDWVNRLVANPSPLSYVPSMGLDYNPPLTFLQKLNNVFYYYAITLWNHLYIYPKSDKLIKKYIPNGPNLEDVLYNASIVFLNSHPSIQRPVPYVPSMIDIGGFHIKPPKKLPKDLQKFLDDAKDGVIYFSMGSNLRSADLPQEKREGILRAFGKLKQKVLWKWENDSLEGKPDNVKIEKWLPQQDILAHKNVKLFITHGGLLSVTETVYHGVPILAIPIFGDQHSNAKIAVTNEFGLSLTFSELDETTFSDALDELLNNPKYMDNARLRSRLFHDRPNTPMDTAAYWVEYVARHGGTPHLRVAGLDLPWYKLQLLDVIAFLLLTALAISYFNYWIIKKICIKWRARKISQKTKTNLNKKLN